MSGAGHGRPGGAPGDGTTRVPTPPPEAVGREGSTGPGAADPLEADRTTTLDGQPSGDDRAAPPAAPDLGRGRYVGLAHVARGGQGDVFDAFDQRLARRVAIKVLRPDRRHAADALRHEVGLLVGLEHPGIVPVHDRGETADGRPWFAMRWLSGQPLGAIVGRMRGGDPGFTPRRALDLLVRVAAALGHAHRQGVAHCDVKPGNVIVGEAGAVYVVDWGIARRVPRAAVGAGEAGHRLTAGTPGYMAPERLAGEAHDARVDVYALGAMLYFMLTGRAPGLVIAPPARWDARWPDGQRVPDELLALAGHAASHAPDARPPDGAAFARRLTDWLDGAQRRDEARALVDRAGALRTRWRALRADAEALRHQARRTLDEVGALADAEAKRPGRALEDAAEARAAEADLVELELVGAARAALNRAADLPEAHALLADHHRDVLEAAEAARDAAAVRRAAALVRAHGDRSHIAWLDGPGALTLATVPPGARVSLARYAPGDGRLLAQPWQRFVAPLAAEPIPPGSYLALIEAPGFAPTRWPLAIARGEHWRNAPPGEPERPLHLLAADALEPDAVFVPGGWCVLGGDPEALDGLPRRRIWVDDFVIERTSTTLRAWRVFVEDVAAGEGPAAAAELLPRHRDTAAGWMRPLDLRADGAVVFGVGEDGGPLDPETPVALVDHRAATRYARWRAARDGLPWRLPHDLEWEKAARGVDGRLWPWGDAFDPTHARFAESFAGRPLPSAVGTCPIDESPYGVRDMAGLVRNWCSSDYQRDGPPGERLQLTPATGPLRMVRGGAWVAAATTCRPAGRFANRPDQRFRTIGVRLARSISGTPR